LSKSVSDLDAFCTQHNIPFVEIARDEVEKNLNQSGLHVERINEEGTKL
jgi:hypothetical protein